MVILDRNQFGLIMKINSELEDKTLEIKMMENKRTIILIN